MSWDKLRGLKRLWQRERMEAELDKGLDKELRFHVETRIEEMMQAGMSEDEARRAARLEFGGMTQIKEECRESRGTVWLGSIVQDLRFGTRILARSPGFSLTAIMVLALGIGVSTLAFSLYNLAALQSIPVRDAASIVRIERRSPGNITPGVPFVSIEYFREHASSLSAVMESMEGSATVFNQDEKRVEPEFVSANYFRELGGAAAAGRLFDAARDGSAASAPVVVLSYRFWQQRFSSDPAVLGSTVRIGGKPATVIGVAARDFANLGTERPEIWLPLEQHSYFVDGSRNLTDPKFDGNILMSGRLAATATAAQAAQELLGLTNQLRPLYPEMIWDKERIEVTPGAHLISAEDSAPVLAIIPVLVLLILGIACANLGGLLSARGVSRQREIELRLHLGARKLRLFRQLLTENLLLGVLGSVAALPLTMGALRLTLNYANAPEWMSAMPDWRVFLFATAMGFLAAVLFGLLPALQLVRRNKARTKGRALWNQFIVCAQVGASCLLLILAGLLVRATLHTLYADPGFQYQQVVSIDPALSEHGYTAPAAKAYLETLETRLRAIPGVVSVSAVLSPPLVNREVMLTSIDVNGHRVLIYPNWVSQDFFNLMGIPLLRGRGLRDGETHAVLLSQSLAVKRWPGEDPIGKKWNDKGDLVVGVVGNTRAMEMNNTDATEIYYLPTRDNLADMSILVRTTGITPGLLQTMKTVSAAIDRRLIPSITPLRSGYEKNVALVEQIASIVALLGGIALSLAVVGLLGLVSYAVSQRTREIAIRLALGAGRVEILNSILSRFAWPVLLGMVFGVAATAALSQIIRRMLYGVSGLDPASYAGALLLLAAVLCVAAVPPIRRAFRVEPATILRAE